MKTSGSYASLVQGVSQQVPHERGPGQCSEQVNLIPDPVLGLTRRHGSIFQAEKNLGYGPETAAAILADTASFRTFEYSNAGSDYVLKYRTGERAAGSPLPPLLIYNRTTKTYLDYLASAPGLDDPVAQFAEHGISAITAVGKYVFMAGNAVPASVSTTNLWDTPANKLASVVWIRGGAYARTFTVTASQGLTTWTFSYKTPTSSYPGTLDTSGVPVYAADPAGGTILDTEAAYITAIPGFGQAKLGWAAWNPTGMTVKDGAATLTNVSPSNPANAAQYRWDAGDQYVYFHSSLVGQADVTMQYTHTKTVSNPNYVKAVQDLQNAYNSAVTQWIGTAANAITPEAIAESIRQAAVVAGLSTGTVYGSTLVFPNIDNIVVDDGGDGSLVRGVANEVSAVDQVSNLHMVGKIVKVQAKGAQEAFYLKAIAKDTTAVAGEWNEVTWVEGAGVEQKPTLALIYGTVSGGSFAVASTATKLTALIGGTHPDYVESTVGDLETVPLPYFNGKRITYLTMFQDRLIIGCGGVKRCSRIGDYLNFYRSSLLTVPADDAFEMLSQSSDDDELRFPVLYDQNLVSFGKKRQYVVSGRQPLTPTSANMAVLSSHKHAANLPPLAVGGVIFYGKLDQGSSSVHQIQPGLVADSPESYPASSQLDDYMAGSAIEITNNAKPSVVFVRTTGKRNSLFPFQFLDTQAGRKQDAWSRWDFDPSLGPIVGMLGVEDGLLMFTIREAHGSMWLVADLCPLLSGLSATPYLDSQRPWATVAANTGSVRPASPGPWKVAFDNSSEFFLIGSTLSGAEGLFAAWPDGTGPVVGADQAAYVVPTNPVVRDRNGQAITTARLTVKNFVVSMAKSSGYDTEIIRSYKVTENTFNGRVLGDPNNLIGRIPVTAYQHSIPVGENTLKFDLKIKARTWLPFTVTALEWIGQWFNRTQRF
jgi:hypothetical protein